MSHAPFSLSDLSGRRHRLLASPPADAFDGAMPDHGDHVLNGGLSGAGARPAAVLVPLIVRADGVHVLLTERAAALRQHSGQIAFPGGKIDADDASPLAAALREAEEEIGLHPSRVEPLGYLDPYQTGTGFRIQPVVALVTPPLALEINKSEVEMAFEVPLAFLMTAANHQRHSREWQGRARHFYAMAFGEHYIWGATAGIVRNLYERLYS